MPVAAITRSGVTMSFPSTRIALMTCSVRFGASVMRLRRSASQAAHSARGRARRSNASAWVCAAVSPARMMSALFLKSVLESPVRSGVMRMSRSPSERIERRTFCLVRMFTICAITPTTDWSSSRPESGVPTFTAMITSAPISRANSTGRLSTRPPSTSMWSPTFKGAKAPGTDIEARIAVPRVQFFCMTMRSPVMRSVADAAKGIER